MRVKFQQHTQLMYQQILHEILMEKLDYFKVKSDLMQLLLDCKGHFSEDAIGAVMHYIDHDEYEMAFEGLFLEIFNANFWPKNHDIKYWTNLGEKLGLCESSVFDGNFWQKLIDFKTRYLK